MSSIEEKAAEEASFSELLNGLSGDVTQLVKNEIELAKKEMAIVAKAAVIETIVLSVGVVLAAYGFFFVVYALVYLLGRALPVWAASFIMGGGLVAISLILMAQAVRALSHIEPLPRTIKTIKEDMAWAKRRNP